MLGAYTKLVVCYGTKNTELNPRLKGLGMLGRMVVKAKVFMD